MEDYVQCRSPFLHVAPKSSILNSCRKMAGGAYSTGLKTNKQTNKPEWEACVARHPPLGSGSCIFPECTLEHLYV